jgi:HEAT repeat protein
MLVPIWMMGTTLLLLRLTAGVAWAAVTVRRASDLPHTDWLDSLDDAASALGVTRHVRLRVSERAAVPMATGLFRAVILLPPAAIGWSADRRRVVLQHELAHVKRWDCLLQAIAQAVCALHWFNPLAHMAVARLRAEQERACDDMVLQVGTDARSYADHLFDIASSFRRATFPSWVAMSMARPSQLEGRVLSILDGARARTVPSRHVAAGLMLTTLAVALPFGALRLSAQPRDLESVRHRGADEPQVDQSTAIAESVAPAVAGHEAPAWAPPVDVVRGVALDVDLLALEPVRAVDGVQHAAVLEDWRDRVAALAFGQRAMTGLLAPVALAAAQNTAVSDDTRRRVADALTSALNDDNPAVRQEALTSLAAMRDERAIPGLVRALSDPAQQVRMRALGALVQFNTTAAADGVLAALKDRSPEVRALASRHLSVLISRGQLRDPKYIDAFTALVRDENAEVREQAVSALGRLRVPAASAPLTAALGDSVADVRREAARSLGQLGNADAVPALLPLLKDPVVEVREGAANALGDLADPRAIDALTAALRDADAGVREEAARALGQIARGQRRGPRAVPGIRVPAPPLPPRPPQALGFDEARIREMAERARETAERTAEQAVRDAERVEREAERQAERAARDIERSFRDFDFRFDWLGAAPIPVPEPAPAPPVPPAPPAPAPVR